jgi:hypothetical protein
MLLRTSHLKLWNWGGVQHAWMVWNMHTTFWSKYLKERGHFEDLCVHRIILKYILTKQSKVWLPREHVNEHSDIIKAGKSWLVNGLIASQEVLCSNELVSHLPMYSTCTADLTLIFCHHNKMLWIMYLWNTVLCNFLQPPAISSLLWPYILPSTMFSNTFSLWA